MDGIQDNNDDVINAPNLMGLKIPENAAGYVGETSDEGGNTTEGDKTPAEMEAAAEAALAKKKAEKKDEGGSNEPTVDTEAIDELKAKYEENPDDLSEAELKLLKETGGLEDTSNNDDEPSEEEIAAKLEELQEKDEADLSDEDKKFLKDHEDEPGLIDHVRAKALETLGVELPADAKYTEDDEGLLNMTKDIASELANKQLSEHYQTNPDFAKFYKHTIIEGNSVDTFLASQSKPEYHDVEITDISDTNSTEANEQIINTQKEILTAALKAKGNDQDEIDLLIESIEDKGVLFEKAKQAKEYLKTTHEAKVQEQLQAEQEAKKAEEQATVEQWQKIQTMLDKNDLGDGIKLPTSDRREIEAFTRAISQPVDKHGNTQIDYMRNKQTLGQQLLSDFLLYKGYDISGVKSEAAKSRALQFKKGKKSNETTRKKGKLTTGSTGNSGGSSHPSMLSSVDFNNIEVR